MFIVSTLMAAIEGVAWYEILSVFSSTKSPIWINATFAFLLASTVWMMDVIFVTSDLAAARAAEVKRKRASLSRRAIDAAGNKVLIAVFARLIYVAISLIVTTPFLSEIFQRDEITIKTRIYNAEQLANLRKQILIDFDNKLKDQIAALKNQEQKSNDLLRQEISGTGASKIPGIGPTARFLMDEIDRSRVEIARARQLHDEEQAQALDFISKNESSIDGLIKISQRYQIQILTNSPADSEKIRELYLTNDKYKIFGIPAERAVAGSLVLLLFVSMLLFKLLEPKSVSIYYNAQLQAAYHDYQNGFFDDSPDMERERRSTSRFIMGAFAFENWYYTIHMRQKSMMPPPEPTEELMDTGYEGTSAASEKEKGERTKTQERKMPFSTSTNQDPPVEGGVLEALTMIRRLRLDLDAIESKVEKLPLENSTRGNLQNSKHRSDSHNTD
jgi:hypothetical protein